ncbi:MAG: TlpA disulfide reductase family protein [Moheibacter sp.]
MRILFLMLFCLSSNFAFSQYAFTVNGEIKKPANANEKIYFTYRIGEGFVRDSIEIKNKKFSINGVIDEPRPIILYNNNELYFDKQIAVTFYIEPGVTGITIADIQNMGDSEIFGGKTQIEYEILQEKLAKLNFKEISVQLQKVYAEQKEVNDSAELVQIQTKIDSLLEEFDNLSQEGVKIRIEFIKDNPTSYVSANSLGNILKQRDGLQIIDTIQSLYNNLDLKIKNSVVGREIDQELKYYYGSRVGVNAPDFSLIDENGEILKLSSLKGKYVLLDFWASWCGPCIEDFPQLKALYKQYSDNFEIIGISRDEKIDNWKNAVQKYEVGWMQISLKENDNNNLEKRYFVNAIPVKVLIAPDGKIIGKWRGGGSENMTELENLLNQSIGK